MRRQTAAVPPDPPPPSGSGLRLTPAQAPAGGLFSLRIEGDAAEATDTGIIADFQRWGERSWRTEFVLVSQRCLLS